MEGDSLREIKGGIEGTSRMGKTLRTNCPNSVFLNIKEREILGLKLGENHAVEQEVTAPVAQDRDYVVDHQVLDAQKETVVAVTMQGDVKVIQFDFAAGTAVTAASYKLQIDTSITEEIQSVTVLGNTIIVQVVYIGSSSYALLSRLVVLSLSSEGTIALETELQLREEKLEVVENFCFLKAFQGQTSTRHLVGVSGVQKCQLLCFEFDTSTNLLKEVQNLRAGLEVVEPFSLTLLSQEENSIATVGANGKMAIVDFTLA